MRNRYLYITLLAVLGWNAEGNAQGGGRQIPRLVVNITIDQLRSDYLENFSPLYGPNGFLRLLTQGVVYENAAYPFIRPDRASAISSVITGTTPYYHSIIGERWLDKETLRPVSCTEDTKQPGVPSPAQLSVSTLGDELKVITQGKAKVFSVAPFRDAAILSAGHAADGAVWLEEQTGIWSTSQYYSNETPSWLLSFNELKVSSSPIKKAVWTPFIIQQKPDFKHTFRADRKYLEYQTSGLINADVTELALQCVGNEGMGYDSVTDLLCLTYYAGSFDNKPMTECPKELQDNYLRLDRDLGHLITQLESRIGAGNILFVLTSSGYSSPEGIDYARYRIPTGIFYINRTANLLNMYFGAIWGQGRYIEACFDNQLFFNHKLLESKRISLTDATQRAREFISQLSGVRNVYTSLQLLSEQHERIAKVRNSFNPQHHGDILIEVAPGWHLQNEDTREEFLSQTPLMAFPIIFYGAHLTALHVQTPVTTDRIAPTLAKAIRIRAPNACAAEPLF